VTAILFPSDTIIETDHDWNLVGTTAVSGLASSVAIDVRSDGGGLWSASLNNMRFLKKEHTLLWRAVRQICGGGVNPIVVPRIDDVFRPFPEGASAYQNVSHSDGALFSDDTGYYQPVISVVTYDGAELRDTILGLQLINCADLIGGEIFSINHPTAGWRLYEIGTVDKIDATHTIVTFNPPLREDVPSGTEVEFDRPRCLMKLQNSSAMDLNTTTYPFSLAQVKFIEAFPNAA
jgi:hypothetical protein